MRNERQLSCVFQESEPPESSSILRKGTENLRDRVRFTKAALRQATIRESQGPSLCKIQVKLPHQGSQPALKFEDKPQEEIGRPERCARGDGWRLAKNIFELKETNKATFFSPTNGVYRRKENLLIDSGSSMHMFRRKDLNSTEVETETL